MSLKLPTIEEKGVYVQQQFDRIAQRYDLTNDAISLGMHRRWKDVAVDALKIKPNGQYLDVCCGTGDLSLLVAKRLQSRGKVIGIDFSLSMLEIAEEREQLARDDGSLSNQLQWVDGDAQSLPFQDNTFDGAIISFGLRNLTDLQAGLNEMVRVVKPGGRVVNLDLGRVRTPLFAPLFMFYFNKIVPLVGLVLQRDIQAYTYLPESLGTYPEPAEISNMFSRAGLINIVHVPLALGSVALHYGTVSEQPVQNDSGAQSTAANLSG